MPLTAPAQRVLLFVLACDILGRADASAPSPPLAPIPFQSTAFLDGGTGEVVGCSTDETTTHFNGEVVAGQCCKAGDPTDPANCQRYVGDTVRGRAVDMVERWGGDRQPDM